MRLIDAEPLLKAVKENKELYERERLYLEGLLLNAPTVDLTKNQAYDKGFITAMKLYSKPQGEWIKNKDSCNDEMQASYYCSECGASCYCATDKYCHECGADMRKVGNK